MRPKTIQSVTDAQAAVADLHPSEFVVMKGRVVLEITSDKERAFAVWTRAWADGTPGEPIVIPPLQERLLLRQRLAGRGAEPWRRL